MAAESGQNASSADQPAGEVVTSNAWETAKFKDDQRKNKFMKLMGAGKKKGNGLFGPAAKAPPTALTPEEIAKRENQYKFKSQSKIAKISRFFTFSNFGQ